VEALDKVKVRALNDEEAVAFDEVEVRALLCLYLLLLVFVDRWQ